MKNKYYQVSEKNLSKIRLIGMNCEISYSGIEFKGKIRNETKNTWQIETDDKVKTVPKDQSKLRITINNQKYEINGNRMKGRHEDRIKQRIKRKW